jgi:hypothetical protein
MEKRKILAGYYRDWSIKSPSRKTKSYREEAGDECLEVNTELEAPAGQVKRSSRLKVEATTEQEMIRDLQAIFCKGRYRSWKPPAGKCSGCD